MIHWCFRQTLVLCLALVISVSAFGQNRANFPWWNSPVVEDLNLTQAQKQKVHQIVRAYRDRLFDARNAHQKAVANLEDILNEPEVNMEAAKPVIDRVTAAQANASKVFLEMSTELRGVLTLDQWRHWSGAGTRFKERGKTIRKFRHNWVPSCMGDSYVGTQQL